jgi:hypothetical protein
LQRVEQQWQQQLQVAEREHDAKVSHCTCRVTNVSLPHTTPHTMRGPRACRCDHDASLHCWLGRLPHECTMTI